MNSGVFCKLCVLYGEKRQSILGKQESGGNQMATIINIENVDKKYVEDPEFKTKKKTIFMGEAAGSEKIFAQMEFVKPGGKTKKFHSHSEQEEFFYVMKGSGILRINEKEVPVSEGDFFAKPAGRGIAHQFINTGNDILQILDFGLKVEQDIEEYPDEGIILLKKQGMLFRPSDGIVDWNPDPNEE